MGVTKSPVKKRRITDLLPVELTDDERLDFADALAEANQAVEIAERNKKTAMQSFNYEIKVAEARREKLAGIVASKQEYREIIIEEKWDYDADKYTKTRTDTGQIVFERRLTDEEKQLEMLNVEDMGGLDDTPHQRQGQLGDPGHQNAQA